MKKLMLFCVALLMVLWIAPVQALAEEPEEAGEAADARTVTIIHTNDIHGRFVGSGSIIGIDTLAAILAAEENAILVDAGDTFHGVPFVNFNEGENAVQLMNLAGYSFFVPGNHDFNFGINRLLELEAIADFEFLAINLFRDGTSVFSSYSIVEVDGVRVGFFGLVYPDTPIVTHPDNVAGLYFGNPVVYAAYAVDSLQEAGADVVIAVAHLGVDGSAWSRRLAQEVPGIHLIIDGHSHTLLEAGYPVGDVLLAQTGAHNSHIGRVDIVVSEGDVSLSASVLTHEYATENFEPVAGVTAAIASMGSDLEEILGEVVGYSPVTLYGDSPEHRAALRGSEVPLGNLVADSIRWGTGAELVIANSGGIRAHLNAGEVTKGNVIEVLAFFNYAVVVEITAAELWDALENGVSNMPGNGRFPQVSGFSFVFDQSAEEGARVLSVMVDGVELSADDTTTTFSLAINDFMAAGGDGYTMLVDLPRLGEFGTQDELLIAYMAVTDLTAVDVEGRIVDVSVLDELEYVPYIPPYIPYIPHIPYIPYVPVPQYEPQDEPQYEPEIDFVEPVVEPVVEVAVEVVAVTFPAGTGTVVNCWYLNVRNRGSSQAGIVGVLRVGDVVIVHESTAWNWHRIEAPHITGWVYGGFLQLN